MRLLASRTEQPPDQPENRGVQRPRVSRAYTARRARGAPRVPAGYKTMRLLVRCERAKLGSLPGELAEDGVDGCCGRARLEDVFQIHGFGDRFAHRGDALEGSTGSDQQRLVDRFGSGQSDRELAERSRGVTRVLRGAFSRCDTCAALRAKSQAAERAGRAQLPRPRRPLPVRRWPRPVRPWRAPSRKRRPLPAPAPPPPPFVVPRGAPPRPRRQPRARARARRRCPHIARTAARRARRNRRRTRATSRRRCGPPLLPSAISARAKRAASTISRWTFGSFARRCRRARFART